MAVVWQTLILMHLMHMAGIFSFKKIVFKTKSLNIGLDLGLLNNKITLSLEYYNRKTDNLILNVSLPVSFGYINGTVPTNVADK